MYTLNTVGDACRELCHIEVTCGPLVRSDISKQIMIILGNEIIDANSSWIVSTENNHPLSDEAKIKIASLLPQVWPIVREEAA